MLLYMWGTGIQTTVTRESFSQGIRVNEKEFPEGKYPCLSAFSVNDWMQ